MSTDARGSHKAGRSLAARLRGGLQALAANPSIRGIAGVLVLKASMMVFNFALIALAANVLQETQFGIYSILFSAVGLVGIVATVGQQILLMRSWNEYSANNDAASLKGALRFSAVLWLAGTMVAACIFYFWADASYGAALARAATVYLVLYAATQTTAHLLRASRGVGIGDGYGNLLPVLPAIGYLTYDLATHSTADVSTVLLLLAGGSAIGLTVHAFVFRRHLSARFPEYRTIRPRGEVRVWAGRSARLWLSTGLEAANQFLDVIVMGILTTPAIAGGYFVTTRFANIFASASDGMHLFASRHVPDLYYRREYENLSRILNLIALMLAAMIAVGVVGIALGGKFVLGLISADYVQYFPALIVLCLGTAAAAAAQPCAPILMLTGHEGRYLAIIATSVLLRVGGFFLLVPSYGIMGAVTASALSFVILAGALSYSAHHLAGFDGSVLRLLRRNTDTPQPLAAG
ncbi:MAG: lipopolysaccharide biosynthesis protein [Rhizobiaceae bacterium]|nr:lipopolysaccharide biosynthesis protein [Rhizobiaceae bacterium]